ncbi:MAG: N-acetylmuramoyl-L-alanine amidase [Bacteroidota bacterium]
MIDRIKTLIQQNEVEKKLRKGSKDKDSIRSLQTALYELGYGEDMNWAEFKADGAYFGGTTGAVIAFAANNEIDSDGEVVSKQMAEKIVEKYEVVADLRVLQLAIERNRLNRLKKSKLKNPLAASFQHLLNVADKDAQLVVDGEFGDGTATAVRNFAAKVGVQTNGEEVPESLIQKIMDTFRAGFGSGWKNAVRSSGIGKFGERYPIKNEGKFKKVKNLRQKSRLEVYKDVAKMKPGEETPFDEILPLKDKKGNKIKDQVWRRYKYEFREDMYKIKGEELEMDYVSVTKFRKGKDKPISSFCYPEGHKDNKPKTQIVLHHTVGVAEGDLRTLSKENYHVSTAYVLGRDGTIYQLFAPQEWSNHLGANEVVNPKLGSARSIGIEVSNFGWLREGKGEHAGKLMTLYNQVYCSMEDKDAYVELPKPYRFHKYYASFTEEQYESIIVMLRYLTNEFNIPKTFVPGDPDKEAQGQWDQIPRYTQFPNDAEAVTFGICSHVNYRLAPGPESGKWDLGPAFDWDRVIEGVQAPAFERKHTIGARSLFGGPQIRTKEEIQAERAAFEYGNQDADQYGPDGPEVDI